MRFASWFLVVVTAAMTPGCLVASEHEFVTEQPFTASIMNDRDADFDIGEIVLWDRREQSLTFQVIVQDPNVEDLLWARWVVRGAGEDKLLSPCNEEMEEDRLIPINGTHERELLFTIEPSQIRANGCYRVELAVSNDFAATCKDVRQNPSIPPIGTPSGNVDVAIWWLLANDGPVPDVGTTCETQMVEGSP